MGEHRTTCTLMLLAGCALVACDGPARHAPEPALASVAPRDPVAEVLVGPGEGTATVETGLAELVARISEPSGYFDTDNLISNERSYLHVLGKLEELGLQGGVYVGVGPDQNFSYIAKTRPDAAFIIDIRRDNLLLHLLFKALFEASATRVEYLARWVGRAAPDDVAQWGGRSLEQIVAYVDGSPPLDANSLAQSNRHLAEIIESFGIPLTADERGTIASFHRTFVDGGLSLRFNSHHRAPQPYYPTLRQLILESDLDGRRSSYLASAEAYTFVRGLQSEDRVIPVVGDLAGPHALREIGEVVREWDESITVFYTSNIEQYLMRGRTFDRFAENVLTLPVAKGGVLIRSYFGRFRGTHPETVPGYASTQLLQGFETFLEGARAGAYQTYSDLILNDYIRLR